MLKHPSTLVLSGHFAGRRLAKAARLVSTTSSSKTQQRTKRQPISEEEHDGHIDSQSALSAQVINQARLQNLNLWHALDTIKRLGHRCASLDPLQLRKPEALRDLAWNYPLMEELQSTSEKVSTLGLLNTDQSVMATKELVDTVWRIYAGRGVGLEFAHLSNQAEVDWLTSQWEQISETFTLTDLDQHNLAKLLLECEAFDHFMAAKYPTVKRYGCEGAESMLVVFDEILRLCHIGENKLTELTQPIGRIDDVIIGMPHRGRLNLLACLLGFEPAAIFQKTQGEAELDLRKAWMAKGDVLSHLSTNVRFDYGVDRQHISLSRTTPEPINVTLLPNPSHLEIASALATGAARGRAHNIFYGYTSSPKFATIEARTRQTTSTNYELYSKTILPVQVHGDASLAGQGIIQETLQMAYLDNFTVRGSLHLVINNQIGYTTQTGRSSRYCTDVFKMIEAPIIHVNAQNIQSVVKATLLALTYRQKFGKDVAIDLICYRQHGHNEMDEPAFTQPLMYNIIRSRKSIPQQYCDEVGLSHQDRDQIVDGFKSKLQVAHKRSSIYKPDNDNYRNFALPTEFDRDHICAWKTGCKLDILKSVALDSVETPENFQIHPNLNRVLVNERRQKFQRTGDSLADAKVDWATAEILAFGSLLKQNHSVRIAGQDVARGTFSTRHAILYDQETGEPYVPLNNMPRSAHNQKAHLEVANTILSEEASLAYEFGYSIETCALTIWEAQFGDFYNTAQSIIDTLISSAESKWLKQSALTLLLPHGLDGAGPEHSSSHIERFLQMSSSSQHEVDTEAKVNWSICFPTLPSQYFHLLRRQVMRPFRKPLVVMSPKVIFRNPSCISPLSAFAPEKSFEPVLDDPTVTDRSGVDTIVLCSGKVYFNLEKVKLETGNLKNVALVRIEELCPFPIRALVQVFKLYPNVDKENFIWLQEEHKNQGAFNYVSTRLHNMAKIDLDYIGRPESELPATGTHSLHQKESDEILNSFMSLKRA